jgi:hypothetical protein
MRKSPRKYTLILVANPKRLGENWLAGSVIAHLVQCEMSGRAFWLCPFRMRGVLDEDKCDLRFDNVSGYGYFYDALDKKISWRFKLGKVFDGGYFLTPDKKKGYQKYFGFREKYLKYGKKWLRNCRWFLISEIEKLKPPFKRRRAGKSWVFPDFWIYTYGKKRQLRVSDFMHNTVFACDAPSAKTRKAESMKSDDLLDQYLKQFFSTKSLDKTLREWAIQSTFALKLMEKKKWDFWPEKPVSGGRGRIDILFKEKRGNFVAVEIKRDEEDTSVNQLKSYIRKLRRKKEYKNRGIQGVIISGKITDALEKRSVGAGFDLLEYKLSIEFPEVM